MKIIESYTAWKEGRVRKQKFELILKITRNANQLIRYQNGK